MKNNPVTFGEVSDYIDKHKTKEEEPKVKEVTNFNDNYFKGQVKERINNITINKHYPVSQNEDIINQRYKDMDIYRFKSKKSFSKYFVGNANGIDKAWNDYKHRDILIRNGQYETERAKLYKQNYMKAMNHANIDQKYINFVGKLPISKWKEFAKAVNPDKKIASKYLLPTISSYYVQKEVDDKNRSDLEEEFQYAMDESGLNTKVLASPEYIKYYENIKNALNRYSPKNQSALQTAQFIGRIPKSIRDTISFKSTGLEYEKRFDVYRQLNEKGKLFRNGTIPFVKKSEVRAFKLWLAKNGKR